MDHVENNASNNSSVVVFGFIATGTLFTEPLPSTDVGVTHIDTQISSDSTILAFRGILRYTDRKVI
jgi:hypothetical protein